MKKSRMSPWRPHANRKERHLIAAVKTASRTEIIILFTTTMSSLAAAAAVVVSIYQYSVSREQLVAADRNRSIESLTEKVRKTCEILGEIKISPSFARRESTNSPVNPGDVENIEKYVSAIVEDYSAAEKEGRMFFDVEKVNEIATSGEFEQRYRQAYKDLRSASQTVRLWAADEDIETLDKIVTHGFGPLDPETLISVPNLLAKTISSSFTGSAFTEMQFAWTYCSSLESIVVDWAKNREIRFPTVNVLPVTSKADADKQVQQIGRVSVDLTERLHGSADR